MTGLVRQHDASVQTASMRAVIDRQDQAVPVPAAKSLATAVALINDVPVPVAKFSRGEANVPFPVAKLTSGEVGGGQIDASFTVAELSRREPSNGAAGVPFPAARIEPLGTENFAFLSQNAATLHARLTVQATAALQRAVVNPALSVEETVQATAVPATEHRQPVALVSNPASVPAEGILDPGVRVASAWRAAEPATAFQALFRNDPSTSREPINPAYLSAFAAQPDMGQAQLFAANALAEIEASAIERVGGDVDSPDTYLPTPRAAAGQVPGQVAMAVSDGGAGGPFNLIGALRYQIFKEPEDLMPPV